MGDAASSAPYGDGTSQEAADGHKLETGRVLYGTTKEKCDSMIAHSLKQSEWFYFGSL